MLIKLYSKRWLICPHYKQGGEWPHLFCPFLLFSPLQSVIQLVFVRCHYVPGIVLRVSLEWVVHRDSVQVEGTCSLAIVKAGSYAIAMYSTALADLCKLLCFHFILFHFFMWSHLNLLEEKNSSQNMLGFF